MASYIPRLEWNFKLLVGTTSIGSDTITGIASTSGFEVGMKVYEDLFPDGTEIIQVNANSLQMSAPAQVAQTDYEIDFFDRFDFSYPSTKQAEPIFDTNATTSESVGGVRQVQVNSVIKKISLSFSFITPAEMDKLYYRFWLLWAIYGKSFDYYESKEVSISETYELDDLDWKPEREIPKGDLGFLYALPIKFRRIFL